MAYEAPRQKTIFAAGGRFWVYEIRGVVALSYTDDKNRALRFKSEDAELWLSVLQSIANCEITRVDLPPDSGVTVTNQ